MAHTASKRHANHSHHHSHLPILVVDEAEPGASDLLSHQLSPQSLPGIASSSTATTGPSALLRPAAMTTESDTGKANPQDQVPNPFNFHTQVISTSPVKSSIGQRRGHRYKHSSVSTQHQIFQEPPLRPPPILPASLPVPTVKEAWRSLHRDQRMRLYWSLCHIAVAMFVFFKSEGSLAAKALSHLVFFDAGSAAICVVVDVLGNFEVWRRSSIRHPFGLERAEILAGLAMSVFLFFGGFDLVAHNLKHFLESMGRHEARHEHVHERLPAGSIDSASAAAIASTLISAYGLRNHARIAKVMRVSYLAALPSILSNPFHFLTLLFSALKFVLLPLLSFPLYTWLDRLICALISLAMFLLGLRVAIAQGLMLLMSYGGNRGTLGVASVVREIESDPNIRCVDEAQIWQVHYGLCMAGVKVSVPKGCDEMTLGRLRSRICTLIQNRLGEGYGNGGNVRWEVTVQTSSDDVP